MSAQALNVCWSPQPGLNNKNFRKINFALIFFQSIDVPLCAVVTVSLISTSVVQSQDALFATDIGRKNNGGVDPLRRSEQNVYVRVTVTESKFSETFLRLTGCIITQMHFKVSPVRNSKLCFDIDYLCRKWLHFETKSKEKKFNFTWPGLYTPVMIPLPKVPPFSFVRGTSSVVMSPHTPQLSTGSGCKYLTPPQ